MNGTFAKISFFIPVYNEEKRIGQCLQAILRQEYPKDKIEILIVDGGSQDNTKKIAASFECVRIFDNPRRLADFGIKVCIPHATGELFVIFAADNELASPDWLGVVSKLFMQVDNLSCAWCRIASSEEDAPVNKYYALIQNDPLSFFVNKNLEQYLKTAKTIQIGKRECYVFEVDKNRPLIWGANGLVYKTGLIKEIVLKEGFMGDNDVFHTVIERGFNKIAYVPNLYIYHHHVKTISQWLRKWRRDFEAHFLQHRETRNMGWIFDSRFTGKLVLWLVYILFAPFILLHTAYLIIRDRNIYWLYHPLMSFLQMAIYAHLTLSTGEGRSLLKDIFSKGLA